MKLFITFITVALVFSASTTLVAGSIVINSQKTLTYRIDDHTPRPYPTDSPRTRTG
jgi:hypothetical protein